MSRMNPEQVSELLRAAGAGAPVYLVGAGGCGMSGLGHLLLDLGHAVAGSDLQENDEVRQLRARGAAIQIGHAPAHLQAARPILVAYSSAVRMNNPDLQLAGQLNLPIMRRATLLAALAQRQRAVCIAGMHGKTTTTALLAHTLEALKTRPSYAIGAFVPQLAYHARFSSGLAVPIGGVSGGTLPAVESENWFVAEADESDGSLREFHPEHAIVLNVDEEHLDYYANFEAVCEEFQAFAGQTSGQIFYCADDPRLVALFAARADAVSFGYNPLAHYRIEALQANAADPAAPATQFEIWHAGERLGAFATRLIGEKNVSNAASVVAFLHQQGHSPEAIAPALASFTGAARRQEELFRGRDFRLFDDYGHHPREILATLRAMKELGGRRLLVAFQPHRYTRTQHLLQEFATCFKDADHLWITEVYAASEQEIPDINGARLAEVIRAHGQPADFAGSLEVLRAKVRTAMQPGDVILFLGAGDITRAAHALAAELRKEAMVGTFFDELAAALAAGTVLRRDEPLAKRTTLRVGGPADIYVEPASEADLARVLQLCAARGVKHFLLGRGSNLLVKDGGIRGVVISLSHPSFSKIERRDDRLVCGAGARLNEVSLAARRAGLAGLEFFEGIPGSVGGALRMNAGAMAAMTFDVVESVRFMDRAGNVAERLAGEIPVSYRSCPLLKETIALGAVLRGKADAPEAIAGRMKEYGQKRWKSQPKESSAGCIFKNPPEVAAGRLVDELGLKGLRVGGAVVSGVHGNFIVNESGATAADVLQLIEQLRQRVRAARGIELHTEVEIVGD
jgi:UDP-N-acetylmuramate--L-alanine ligase/UDP-N-acetylenolpyruvoylglucosamine reductase